jgi:hypothetical protein
MTATRPLHMSRLTSTASSDTAEILAPQRSRQNDGVRGLSRERPWRPRIAGLGQGASRGPDLVLGGAAAAAVRDQTPSLTNRREPGVGRA